MRVGLVAVLGAAVMLGGCVQQGAPQEEPKIFGRADCQRAANNPVIQQDFELARQVCLPRAEAAAVSGTTAIPVGHGLAGAMMSGIERGMAQNQIATATVTSCMAERGYLLRTRTEHEAACAAIAEQKAAAERTKRGPQSKATAGAAARPTRGQ